MDNFFLCFGLVLGIIVIGAAAIAGYYLYNLAQPLVTRNAKVIGKRTSLRQMSGPPQTNYYCSFEFEDGERAEYAIDSGRYGLIAEGDRGKLDTKGALFWDFRREIP